MKKMLLLIFLGMLLSTGSYGFTPDASFQSFIDNKIFFFDFSEKKVLLASVSGDESSTYNLSWFCSNWDAKVGSYLPTAVHQNPSGTKVYFIDNVNEKYWRYDYYTAKIDDGYPLSLAGWPSDWIGGGATYSANAAIMRKETNTTYIFDLAHEKFIKREWGASSWSPTMNMTDEFNVNGYYESIDYNNKYSMAASYDDAESVLTWYNFYNLSYTWFSWDAGCSPAITLGDMDWPKNWTSNEMSGACHYSSVTELEGKGRVMRPLVFNDMPSGSIGSEYQVDDVRLTVVGQSNIELSLTLYSGSNPDDYTLVPWNVMSGQDLGMSCSNPMVFTPNGTPLNAGTGPYVGSPYKPYYAFSMEGWNVSDIWWLEVDVPTSNDNGQIKYFNVDFSPKRDLQCGVEQSYHVDAGMGVWNDIGGSCVALGDEDFYKFTPTETKQYLLENTTSGEVNTYFYIKNASDGFNSQNWICTPSIVSEKVLMLGVLTAGETYYILAKGIGTGGLEGSFKIKCPCDTPTNIGASNVEYTSAAFYWSASSASLDWQVTDNSALVQSGNVTANNVTVSGLTPGKDYVFSVIGQCSNGGTSFPASYNFTTESCTTPSGLSASNNTINSFVVTVAAGGPSTKKWQVVPAGNGFGNGIVAQGEEAGNTFLVSGLQPGNSYDFYIQSQCGSAYSTEVVLAGIGTLTGVNDLAAVNRILVYPNPVQDKLFVDVEGVLSSRLKINILNSTGKLIKTASLDVRPGMQKTAFDVSNLPKGLYHVRLFDEKGTASHTFVKD